MGFSIHSTRFLVQAWQAGLRFESVLTLGRQHMQVGQERMESLLQAAGAWPPPEGAEAFHTALAATKWRFEVFAHALGAREVLACDASDYEGAAVIHDLNQPIPDEQAGRFDLVIDGGTLEHVFNFPVAIANCMRLVREGGHLMVFTPANNYCGHGFYQFSPELFYRVLSPENGFRIERMVALADNTGTSTILGVPYPFPISGPWHEVHDPAEVRERVTLINDRPAVLMILARKLEAKPLFARTPQQSDYVALWEGEGGGQGAGAAAPTGLAAWLRARFGESFCREMLPRLVWLLDPLRLRRFRRRNSFANSRLYRRLES